MNDATYNEQNNCTCKKCGTDFIFLPEECFWDENGFGYSTKLIKCPECGCINVVKHIEDYSIKHLNNDRRLYFV